MKPIGALYLGYGSFFLSIFGLRYGGMVWNYSMNIVFIAILFVFLWINKRDVIIGRRWPIVVGVILISLLGLFLKNGYFTSLLVVKVLLLIYFMSHSRIGEIQLIRFLNITYLFYVTISILFYLFLPSFFDLKEGSNNIMNLGGVSLIMLQSIEGSAASLDTYSALVLVMNLSFAKKFKKWKFYVFLSCFVLLWTFRLTPLFGLCLALAGALYVNSGKKSLIFIVIFIFAPFFFSIYLYRTNIDYQGVPIQFILNAITHNRVMIWDQQLHILSSNYGVWDYIFGNFSSELFSVQSYQVDGSLRKDYFIDNPHNSYLYLYFRSPLLFALSFVIVMRRIWSKYEARWWPVVIIILVGALTNGQLLTLQNPIPLIVLIFYLMSGPRLYTYVAKY